MLIEKIQTIMNRDLNDTAKLREAVSEIEVALAASTEHAATPEQLGDLADAIDAFRDRSYGVATALARAAASKRRKVEQSRRPASMLRTLAELRETFELLRDARSKRVVQPKQRDL
jgi:hypothetical protein